MITNTLIICLVLSIALNLMLLWYIRNLIKYLDLSNKNIRKIFSSLVEFEDHLDQVYNMDIFYGDSTLESLLKHCNGLATEIQNHLQDSEELLAEKENA